MSTDKNQNPEQIARDKIDLMLLKIKKNKDLENAIRIIWMISAIMFLVVLTLIVFIPEHFILTKMPTCENINKGTECVLCGSSRAFIEIVHLNFSKAYHYNKASIFLFILLAINSLTYLINNQFNIKIFKTKL